MPDELPVLTLGFVGDDEVHRTNCLALLKDLVAAFHKQHRKAEVRVLLPEWDKPTDTMSDIDDWAATAGYDVAHVSAGSIVTELLDQPDACLILVGNPEEDETVYAVAEEAAKCRVKTRSLINGLEKVVFDDEDFDDDGFHEVDLDDEDAGLDFPEDETYEGISVIDTPDLDVLADLADGGEVEAQEEIKTIAAAVGIDTAPFETWVDAVEAIRGKNLEAIAPEPGTLLTNQEDPADDGYYDPEKDPELDEDPAEVVAAFEAGDKGVTAPTNSREQLEALTFEQVKAIGLDFGIPPGRGMTQGVFINKILEAQGILEVQPPTVKKRAPRKKKLEVVPDHTPGKTEIAPTNVTYITGEVQTMDGPLTIVARALRKVADELDPPV
jgi:hypothetical protein